MKNNKEILKKLKALLLAGTVSTTLSGCTVNITYDKENHSLNIITDDEETEQTIDKIISSFEKSEETTNTTITTTSEAISSSSDTQTITDVTTQTELSTVTTALDTQELPINTTYYTEINTPPIAKVENKYIINSSYQSKGEYLYSIVKKIYGTTNNIDTIKEMNNLKSNYVENDQIIVLPSKMIYYNAKQGQTLEGISKETGISCDEISTLNNVDAQAINSFIENDSQILIKVLEKDQDNFKTDKGTANIYQGNIIYADEMIAGTGAAGKTNQVLTLNNSQSETGVNFVSYLIFDGSGDYTIEFIASEVKDIGLVEGIPVVFAKEETKKINTCEYYAYDGEVVFSPIVNDLTIIGCEKLEGKTK